MERLGKNVNIFNEKGIILSSGDETRIDSFHEGAFQVIQTGKQLVIYETEKLKLLGTLPGINLPIKYEEKVIGENGKNIIQLFYSSSLEIFYIIFSFIIKQCGCSMI